MVGKGWINSKLGGIMVGKGGINPKLGGITPEKGWINPKLGGINVKLPRSRGIALNNSTK